MLSGVITHSSKYSKDKKSRMNDDKSTSLMIIVIHFIAFILAFTRRIEQSILKNSCLGRIGIYFGSIIGTKFNNKENYWDVLSFYIIDYYY
jgi:hypothetical protein